MNRWQAAARTEEIAPGRPKTVEIQSLRIALFKIEGDEKIYAIQDLCTHDESTLADGFQDNDEIECARHGARFKIRTGAVTAMPAVTPVRTFETRTANGLIEVLIP